MKKDRAEDIQCNEQAQQDCEAVNKDGQEADRVVESEQAQSLEPQVDPNIEKIEALQKERDDYIDALKRERADFENFKKRNQALSAKVRHEAVADTAAKFLPVMDNLERALSAAAESGPLTEGVRLVEKQLIQIIMGLGVKEIEAEGKAFDPNLHEAIMQVDGEAGEESGTVKKVMQKGYVIGGRVLRHSIVMVIK